MGTTTALVQWAKASRAGARPWAKGVLGRATERVHTWLDEVILREIDERLPRIAGNVHENGVDEFGLDLQWGRSALSVVGSLYKYYFRCEVSGIENVPSGRVLLISNHSGQLPIDGAMIGSAIFFEGEPPRIVRSMVEKWTQTLPFVSVLFSRVGQVVGVPENARRLLEQEEAILVFPEGTKGISKPYSKRYQLQQFGLGFMRLALETNTPIVPVAVVGAEEQFINFANLSNVAKVLNMPSFPVVPQFVIPGLQWPLPTKYRIYFGKPMTFQGDADDDDAVIEEKVWVVKTAIQSMVKHGLRERKGIFF
jgi:1-acyl-sn-glycerol-3-phosphate acyltransferase